MGASMLTLSGKVIDIKAAKPERSLILISRDRMLPMALRKDRAFLSRDGESDLPEGFGNYIRVQRGEGQATSDVASIIVGEEFDYLDDGDIVSVSPTGHLRSIFRANSEHNSILLTERCNNYCLMCSQPPKDVDDGWLLNEAMDAIRLMPRTLRTLGITGGEPTLLGQGFIDLVRHIKSWLPRTTLHILSNGRSFADQAFAQRYARVGHPDVMLGIPLYACDPTRHDYVVQARGAFDETVRGILNLKQYGQRVEIRVVLHKQTYQHLPALAQYIASNLLFVDHVALMGLEMTGFTRANLDALWIDPVDYKAQLSEATQILAAYGIRTSVYNHPLCLVDQDVEPFYVKSISDWKNEYAKECEPCSRKEECGGFFSSGLKYGYSQSLKPFTTKRESKRS
jgi:His-Xaa-Ser system radical SAM maturase HxsC